VVSDGCCLGRRNIGRRSIRSLEVFDLNDSICQAVVIANFCKTACAEQDECSKIFEPFKPALCSSL
jgi:hypothetical protein